MGYNTTYDLELKRDQPSDKEIIADLRQASAEAEYALVEDGSCRESSKWYEHEEDMKRLSIKFPDVLFVLTGEGEENEDMWVKYFKNGKMQVAKAQVTFEEFDFTKLEG